MNNRNSNTIYTKTKLPNKELRKKLYDLFLAKRFKNVAMYLKVKEIRNKALYESIKNDLSKKEICHDYKVFCQLLNNDTTRSVKSRSRLSSYLYNKLPIDSWYKIFMAEQNSLKKQANDILSLIDDDDIPEKKQYSTSEKREAAIYSEMMNFDG